MILKPCVQCSKLIPYGRRRCDECEKTYEADAKEYKNYQKSRFLASQDPKYDKFYRTKEWKMLRADHLQSVGYKCERCVQRDEEKPNIATQVHHKTPIKINWNLRLTRANLEALCDDCHNEEHDRFKRKTPRQ